YAPTAGAPATRFCSTALTTLDANISDAATSVVVTTAAGFPATASALTPFGILIDGEVLIVTNVSGTTFTVARGGQNAAGTASVAVPHSAGATAKYIPLTKMVRVDPVDNGVSADDAIITTTTPQDLNFDGTINGAFTVPASPLLHGSNDWSSLRL